MQSSRNQIHHLYLHLFRKKPQSYLPLPFFQISGDALHIHDDFQLPPTESIPSASATYLQSMDYSLHFCTTYMVTYYLNKFPYDQSPFPTISFYILPLYVTTIVSLFHYIINRRILPVHLCIFRNLRPTENPPRKRRRNCHPHRQRLENRPQKIPMENHP